MRIIGGEHRGRRIAAPAGSATRPMLDRVREAMFSTLESRHGSFEGVEVLDLFSGSGSLGLEALSRGARSARFVERDRRTVALLQRNARDLGLAERAEVVRGNALDPAIWGRTRFGVVFFDPPYALLREDARGEVLEAIGRLVAARLVEGGTLVFHVPRVGVGPYEFAPTLEAEDRTYGTSRLWYVRAAGEGR